MKKFLIAGAVAALATASQANAAVSIANTGANSATPGASDAAWKVFSTTSTPTNGIYVNSVAAQIATADPAWLKNSDTSRWISYDGFRTQASDNYFTYYTSFSSAANDTFTFNYAVDNDLVKVLLDGVDVTSSVSIPGSFTSYSRGTIANLTASDAHQIAFVTFNAGGVRNENPAGFRLENVAAVPEPATWAMMLVGFAMVGGTARYRRRRSAVVYS